MGPGRRIVRRVRLPERLRQRVRPGRHPHHSRQPAHPLARGTSPGCSPRRTGAMSGAQALYRPLVLATYAVNYAIHGLSTYGYTAVNIALHAAVSLLLFALVRGIGGSLFAAGVSGIAFAVHPGAHRGRHGDCGTDGAAGRLLLSPCDAPSPAAAGSGPRAMRLPGWSARVLRLRAPVEGKRDDAPPRASRHGRARSGRGTSDGQPAVPRSRIVSDYLPLMAVALALSRGAARRARRHRHRRVAQLRRSTIPWCRSRRCRWARGWARRRVRRS